MRYAQLVRLFLLCASLVGILAQPSPNPSDDFWITDGLINAIVVTNDTVYLGGDFSYVGPQTGPGALFDSETAAFLGNFPRVNGTIYAVESDGAGGWFLGGEFTQIGGFAVTYVAHINSELKIDYRFNPKITGSGVYALLRNGDVLFVGGQFTKVQGFSESGVVGVNTIDGSVYNWHPALNGRVNALAISGNVVYSGGSFTAVGSTLRNRLAAIDLATAKATDWNPNADNTVFTLKIVEPTVYAGGQFTSAGGKPRNRLAAIDMTTGQASAWNPNPNGTVRTLEISGDILYLGGDFSALGVQNRNKFAGVNRTTGVVQPLDLQIEGSASQVWSVRAVDNRLFVGGYFSRAQGRPHPLITAVNPETGQISDTAPLGTSYNGTSDNAFITSLGLYGQRLACAGSFQSLGGVARENAAALDTHSGRVTSWSVTPSSPVLALACSPSSVYLAGGFTNVNGRPVTGLAAVDPTSGNIRADFVFRATNKTAAAVIKSLLLTETRLYVGGEFSNLREVAVRMLGVVDPTNGLPSTFDAKIVGGSGGVIALARSSGNIYVAGDFTSVGGQTRARLAALSEAKAQVDPWNPAPNRDVTALATTGDRVYVGGAFTTIGGVGLHGVAAFSVPSHELLPFDTALPTTASGITAIAATENRVYFIGGFESIGGEFRKGVACLGAASALAYDWDPAPSATPKALAVSPELICAGGSFRTVGKPPNARAAPFLAIWQRNPLIVSNESTASTMTLTATTGDRSRAVLESSTALNTWSAVTTNTVPGQLWSVELPKSSEGNRFFRFTSE